MVENCYTLYSCDGSYEPIISNFSGLSTYSSSYISVNSIDSVTIDETCFYVLSLGVIDCTPTNEITISTGITCNCQCYCYFIRSVDQTTDVTYVNCNDEIIVDNYEIKII